MGMGDTFLLYKNIQQCFQIFKNTIDNTTV